MGIYSCASAFRVSLLRCQLALSRTMTLKSRHPGRSASRTWASYCMKRQKVAEFVLLVLRA